LGEKILNANRSDGDAQPVVHFSNNLSFFSIVVLFLICPKFYRVKNLRRM